MGLGHSQAILVFCCYVMCCEIATDWESGQQWQQNLQFLHPSFSCEKLSECRIFHVSQNKNANSDNVQFLQSKPATQTYWIFPVSAEQLKVRRRGRRQRGGDSCKSFLFTRLFPHNNSYPPSPGGGGERDGIGLWPDCTIESNGDN